MVPLAQSRSTDQIHSFHSYFTSFVLSIFHSVALFCIVTPRCSHQTLTRICHSTKEKRSWGRRRSYVGFQFMQKQRNSKARLESFPCPASLIATKALIALGQQCLQFYCQWKLLSSAKFGSWLLILYPAFIP